MKKLLYTLAAVLVCTGAAAQNPTLYFMEGVPLRSQMNPALAPQRGYFNIPVLGGLAVTAGGNTSLDHLLFRRDGRLVTLLSPSVSSADALSDLHSENLVNADIRVNLLGFGAYTANRKHFWSFDLNLRTSVSTQFPYELFHFFKTGESAQVRNLGLSSDAYAEAGFNYSFPIGEKFYVGARVKFLVGLARAKSYFTQFNVSLGENEWYAEAVGELEVNSNLLTIPTRQEAGQDGVYRNYYQLDDMEFDAKFKPAGYGAAFDIGATYEPIPNLLVSAAINDIGFIAWNKASSMHGTVSRRLTFDGAQVDASGVADIDFDLGELKFEQVDEESATRMLHYTMNLGAEYRLWDRRVGFGALYQIHKYDYAALHNLTASVNFQPVRWFGLSGSYSFIDNRASALGLGLNLNPGWINFYIATDVLLTKKSAQWIPIKQGRMNFNLGIGVPMGKRGLRQRDCIRVNAACCPSQEPLTEQQELRIREQQLREQASATSEQIEEATERSEKAIRKAERRAAKAERKARKAAERAQQEDDTASVVRAAADLLAVRY
ncbi:DUF5723 family protein [Alistipes communis]|uniref:DUF5723 family protein n=1 Tax=Alistipes communis TaxID=2585118 RepID=UPI003A8AD37A